MLDYSIDLFTITKEMGLKEFYSPADPKTIKIFSSNLNRLGLNLIGSIEKFDRYRIMVMGRSENFFLSTLTTKEIERAMSLIFSRKPPVLIITHGIHPRKELITVAQEHEIPVLISKKSTSDLVSELTPLLSTYLAPRVTRHGGLLNVYGEGVLLIGESGVGKSETAIELLKRGHKLVADDLVEIRRMPKGKLVGAAPDNIRHFIEVRGIGIINASRMFGVGSILPNDNIDMVINLSYWQDDRQFDRTGLDTKYTELLNVKVPYIDVPVRPGRNIAVIIEIAAMNNRHRKMGYNAAKELFTGLGMEYKSMIENGENEEDEVSKYIWNL